MSRTGLLGAGIYCAFPPVRPRWCYAERCAVSPLSQAVALLKRMFRTMDTGEACMDCERDESRVFIGDDHLGRVTKDHSITYPVVTPQVLVLGSRLNYPGVHGSCGQAQGVWA